MTPSPLKLAFLGGSTTSAVGRTHRIAATLDRRFEVVAGCFSRHAESNHHTAQDYGVPLERCYADLTTLLHHEAQRIDAIAILTPTDQHMAQVCECVTAGVAVLCEKALATSSADIVTIQQHIHQYQGFVGVMYNYLGYPVVRELQHLIAEGRLGRIHQIQVEMPQEGFARIDAHGNPMTPQEWRLHDGDVPTISLDLGVHLHALVRYLTGQSPLRVVANSHSHGHFEGIIDHVSSLIDYTNDLHCTMWYSKTALGQRNGLKIRVFGTHGAAEWLQEQPEILWLADQRGNRQMLDRAYSDMQVCNQPRYTRFKAGHPAGFIEAFANYYADLADALIAHRTSQAVEANVGANIETNDGSTFGVNESLEGLQLLEAIAISSKTRQWIRINPTAPF
jgi:predicted dehydrogenase